MQQRRSDGMDDVLDDAQESLAEPMRSRWSPSVFDDTHVLRREEIRLLLTAARWAPSCGNAQPAHFIVAERGSGSHRALVRHLRPGNAGWVPRASAVLIVGAQHGPDESGAGGYKPDHADYDTGQAAAHVCLQAHAMGLRAHQFAGFDRDAVARELGVPPFVRLLAGIAVGIAGDPADVEPREAERDQRVRRREPLATRVHGDRWGDSWLEEG